MGSCSCVRVYSDSASLQGLTIKQNSEFCEVYLDSLPKCEEFTKGSYISNASTISSKTELNRKNLESAFLRNPIQRIY